MSWSTAKGWNFRATSGYVTDGTNETYSIGESYPTTRTIGGDSVTFGWEQAVSGTRDRSTTVGDSPECSGIAFMSSAVASWRVDLPATGTYKINAAFGDASGAQGVYWQIQDTSTTLTTIGSASTGTTGADYFYDVSGNQWNGGSTWKTSAVQFSGTFSTTIFRATAQVDTFQPNVVVAHIDITPPGAAVISLPQQMMMGVG